MTEPVAEHGEQWDSEPDSWKAPYIAYSTLVNFIDQKLGANPLPPRIDRGFLETYSGSVRPLLLGTLRTMGLIGEHGEVLQPLRDAARSPQTRKGVFRTWAEQFYREQHELASQHATSTMLQESFARHKYQGSTLRKAIVFYLSLVDDVGLSKSPHFRPPKQIGPGSGRTRPRRMPAVRISTAAVAPAAAVVEPAPLQGEQKTVVLGAAGTVTIIVNVKWLDLPGKTFTALRKAIRDLEALGETSPTEPPLEDRETSEDMT